MVVTGNFLPEDSLTDEKEHLHPAFDDNVTSPVEEVSASALQNQLETPKDGALFTQESQD